MNVTFKFNLGDLVTNRLGGTGMVDGLLYDKSGNSCLVKSADGHSNWWLEKELSLKTEETK